VITIKSVSQSLRLCSVCHKHKIKTNLHLIFGNIYFDGQGFLVAMLLNGIPTRLNNDCVAYKLRVLVPLGRCSNVNKFTKINR
jgi:hypothetical protein